MPVKTIATGRALMGGGAYADKVLGFGPVAYWPLWETSGTVANCLVNSAQNGTYSSAVNTWPVGAGIGDDNTAPRADGTNDYIDVFTATFDGAFNGSEGTLAMWLQVANAGVWTDGLRRDANLFLTFLGDYIALRKSAANNQFDLLYSAGGVINARSNIAMATTDWFHAAITWSAAANEARAYLNGIQEGAVMAPVGVWAGGGFQPALCCLAATNTTPNNPWQGGIAHAAVWTSAQAPATIAALAVV